MSDVARSMAQSGLALPAKTTQMSEANNNSPKVQEANKQAKAQGPLKPPCSQTVSTMKMISEGLEVAVILQSSFASKIQTKQTHSSWGP